MENFNRIFSMSDASMIETAYTLHSLFNDHMADFTALDAQLDAAFATAWIGKIDAASTAVRDSQIIDIQAQLTQGVEVQMDLCRKKYLEVKYFADKAMPNSPNVLKEFGTETYSSISRSQADMVNFMDEMNHPCLKYSTELLAAGMTQAQIDDVQNLRDSLLAANTAQENYMRGRPLLTQNRVATLNECYTQSMKVVEVAMLVYYDNPASKNMFVFNRGSSCGGNNGNGDNGDGSNGNGNTTDTVSMLIVADNIPVQIYSIAYNPTRQYVLTNNGPGEVEFYITDDINGMGTPILLLAGDSQTFTAQDLGYIGDLLIAKAMTGIGAEADITAVISL